VLDPLSPARYDSGVVDGSTGWSGFLLRLLCETIHEVKKNIAPEGFMDEAALPILLFALAATGLAIGLLVVGWLFGPWRASAVKEMPYESGMDPIHDTRRRFDVRFHLVAIAFLVFDVELLFLYPWAVAARPTAEGAAARGIDAAVQAGMVSSRGMVFAGVMVFLALLVLGFVYDWRKGVFRWR
jgi:NADH-quinone oxidoreductase subunit A